MSIQFFLIQHGVGSHIGFLIERFILHDTMLGVFPGVENIGVESKITYVCRSWVEI